MMDDLCAPLRFNEGYMPRVWGGSRLAQRYGKAVPESTPMGEAWLIADHPQHESLIVEGPLQGQSLRQLMDTRGDALLGTESRPAKDGRFPLLLKILDTAHCLSVQVHPDDQQARDLGEPDGGKTEMWHVLDADPGAEILCGFREPLSPEAFRSAAESGAIGDLLHREKVTKNMAVFVPAGKVHAIGAGFLIAEIQQNSDLTYRVYDWGRSGQNANPRVLHLDKAAAVSDLSGHQESAASQVLSYSQSQAEITVEGACTYFVAEHIALQGDWEGDRKGRSFAILLCIEGAIEVAAGHGKTTLKAGEALLVPAIAGAYHCSGTGAFMHYYCGDLQRDVIAPLEEAGHSAAAIAALLH